ncbi:hypothetical protein QT971_17450 [Microcoleus sp. herbarium19]|uniref:hypothetical protein n=1 Tax=unclassified Microcoleus TaxID=2642155 RepID=UPI002FD17A45
MTPLVAVIRLARVLDRHLTLSLAWRAAGLARFWLKYIDRDRRYSSVGKENCARTFLPTDPSNAELRIALRYQDSIDSEDFTALISR